MTHHVALETVRLGHTHGYGGIVVVNIFAAIQDVHSLQLDGQVFFLRNFCEMLAFQSSWSVLR